MEKKIDEPTLDAWADFLKAHAALIRHIERQLAAAAAVPLTWYDILLVINSAPDKRCRLSDIAQRVVLTRSGLTRSLDRLEKAGYLRREPCEEDRRGAYAALTDDGVEALRVGWRVYRGCIREYFADVLTPAEVRAVGNAMGKVLRAVPD